MNTQNLTNLVNDASAIAALSSKYSLEELNLVTFMLNKQIEVNEKNYIIMDKIQEFGHKLIDKINNENFLILMDWLDLNEMSVDELLKSRMIDVKKGSFVYYDFALGVYVRKALKIMETYKDKEIFEFINKFSYRLNNNNPYQGWSSEENEFSDIDDALLMLESIKSFNLDYNCKDTYKKVRAIISLIQINKPVNEFNISIITAMGEYNSNYSIYVGTMEQYFNVISDFAVWSNKVVNGTDVGRVLREITRIYGYHSNSRDKRLFVFDNLNKEYCLLSRRRNRKY